MQEHTLTSTHLPELYDEARLKLLSELERVVFVDLTDCWTSLRNQSYLTATAHYINANIILISRVLESQPSKTRLPARIP